MPNSDFISTFMQVEFITCEEIGPTRGEAIAPAVSSKCKAEWQRVEKLIGSVGRDKIEFICGTDVEFPL